MNLISRYLFREVLVSWLLVMLVLFVILMSNQFAEILGEAAANELPRDAVLGVMALTAVRYLTLLSPIALFLGIMLALARLNRDSETAALFSCGYGPVNFLVPIGLITCIIAAGSGWLSIVTAPSATRQIAQIKFEAEAQLEIGVLQAGRFVSPGSGATVFYAERVDGENIYDVFWSREIEGRVVVILAERGQRVQDPETGMLSFVLFNGTRHEGRPGDLDFSVIEFGEHGIPIRATRSGEFEETVEMRSAAALFASSAPEDQAEIQWRISSPLSLLVLALLAVPLSRSSPREGRFARIGAGLLIYITYANMLSVARVWVERGQVPAWLGMWWVHVALALLGLVLFGREAGWFVRATFVSRETPA